jgi:hypothetical protein
MNLKLLILITTTIIGLSSYAQSLGDKPSMVVLKSGDTIKGIIGKFKGNSFKYRAVKFSTPYEIDADSINFIKIRYSKGNIITYKYLEHKDSQSFLPFKTLVLGEKAELYSRTENNMLMGTGGMPMNKSVTIYYIRKIGEEKLQLLGAYDIFGNLKETVINYFSDCESLVEKINNRTFKIKKQLPDIVKYYNNNCE